MSYRQFIDLLAKHKIPIFHYSPEELEEELRTMEAKKP
jgi:predicted HTH domain antitoxin